jgi:hypothetical protein
MQSIITGCFCLFWWGLLGWVALHQVTRSKKLNNKLKVIITPLSETKSECESFTILFYDNPLNSTHGCLQTAVTVAMVTKNVRMSRRWKSELVVYRIYKQPSPSFMHLLSLKPDRLPVYPVCPKSFQHLIVTLKSHSYQTVHQNMSYE